MLRVTATAILSILGVLAAPTALAANGASTCSAAQIRAAQCSASVDSDSLDIAVLVASAGAAPGGSQPGTSAGTGSAASSGEPVEITLCRVGMDCGAAPANTASGPTPITVADLASFTPAVGELVVQPENWGVLGIPTNFVATATDHIQEGTLLDQPVEVRWRPVGFTFDYGDGTVVTTSDPGAMWTSSDDDWTTTSTSHEYEERGEYTATVTITFEADISTAAGWATVPGTLELAAPAEGVRIFEVQTVLTRGDCIEYPNDPGCAP